MKENIRMVDLVSQYQAIKPEIDTAIAETLETAWFIKGPVVSKFEQELSEYLGIKHVISCANGTDALQVALMALDLEPGDEVIVPAFTYAATAEVIALLRLTPIMVDVQDQSFNTTAEIIESAITEKTRVIIPVHLFGQCSEMEDIMKLAEKYNLFVIEDNAQAIGSKFTFRDGREVRAGGIGHIGTTSFFPSKNLGCYGDGGAIFTNDDALAKKISSITDHGQSKKYFHAIIGVNSRLDALQAGILSVKLKRLDAYASRRVAVADYYDQGFEDLEEIHVPHRMGNSTHVFHQYTMRVTNGKRDELKEYLISQGIPSMIYYPLPLYKQEAYKHYWTEGKELPTTEKLCNEVLSLPIHTEMKSEIQDYIIEKVRAFMKA